VYAIRVRPTQIAGDHDKMLRPLVAPIGTRMNTADPTEASTTVVAISATSAVPKLVTPGSSPSTSQPTAARVIRLTVRTAASWPRWAGVDAVTMVTLPSNPNNSAG